jgi:MoaA/NifB/PqqE/SkfB family radical SAM enzyme
MRVYWDITKGCNLRCIYCYNREFYDNRKECDLRFETIEDVVDQMKANDVDYVHFMGGEPFLRSDFSRILTECDESGIDVGIATNGTLLDDAKMDHLCSLKNLAQITFSIDSFDENIADQLRGRGNWRKSVKNLQHLIDLKSGCDWKCRIGIESVITQLNLQSAERNILWASSLGVEAINFDIYKQPMSGEDDSKSGLVLSYAEIFDLGRRIALMVRHVRGIKVIIDWGFPLYKAYLNAMAGFELFENLGKRCPIILNSIWVGNEGAVQPCFYVNSFNAFRSDLVTDLSIEKREFSLRTSSLRQILRSEYFKELYRFMHTLSARRPFELCADCPFLDVCDACPLDIMRFGEKSIRECHEFIKWKEQHE